MIAAGPLRSPGGDRLRWSQRCTDVRGSCPDCRRAPRWSPGSTADAGGGVRGAMFAIFTPSASDVRTPVARDDGVLEFELAREISHERAAAFAAAAAGRLLALERDGHVRLARRVADLDAAHDDHGPPVAVMHLEGAEAIDPALEALDLWYAAGLRSLGPVWGRPGPE